MAYGRWFFRNNAHFFTILADETTDFAHKQQLTVCLRYVRLDDCAIPERLLCLGLAPDLTGSGLASQFFKWALLQLNWELCVRDLLQGHFVIEYVGQLITV